ncbi:MAG: gliding motility lipoprotein GldH [Bacteroidetes bacterium]|nr:gliding motility lipoprotein GldH [Bacteroidota bacterium]
MKKVLSNLLPILIFSIFLTLFSCNSIDVCNQKQTISNNVWVRDQTADFDVEIKDSIQKYDVSIVIRHASYYPYANLVVELFMTFPTGEERVKEHDLLLRNKDGSFLGEGMGDIWDISIPVYKNHVFNALGKYKFTIRNVMPVHETPGLMEIGLNIKKSK